MRLYIFMVFVALCTTLSATVQRSSLNLNLKNGTTQTIYLDDYPKLNIEGDELTITLGKTVVSYALKDLSKYNLTVEAGMREISIENVVNFVRYGDTIVVDGAGRKSSAKIYSVDGTLMDSCIGDKITIDISGYPAGVYLLNIDGSTAKILKQ